MPRYRLNKETRKLEEIVEQPRRKPVAPMIQSDIAPYMSPVGSGEIGSRSQRREDLKRHNCREVDPSERREIDRITKVGNDMRKNYSAGYIRG